MKLSPIFYSIEGRWNVIYTLDSKRDGRDMDWNLIITGGIAIASAALAYIAQSMLSKRERRWAVESEEKRIQREQEAEKKNIRRELLSNRLNVVEEAVNLKIFFVRRTLEEKYGEFVYQNKILIDEKAKRLEEIEDVAWNAVMAIDSNELKDNYKTIASAYANSVEFGDVSSKGWEEASKAYANIARLIDDMKISL